MTKIFLAAAFAAAAATGAHAATISTVQDRTIGNFISSESYGQTFKVGSDNILTDATFSAASSSGSAVSFDVALYAWNAVSNTLSGTALFQSTGQITSTSNANPSSIQLSFGNLALSAGQKYMLYFTDTSSNGSAYWGGTSTDQYADGEFHFSYNGGSWHTFSAPDMAFTMNFSPDVPSVPLPAGLPLLVGAFAAMGIARRRKTAA